MQLSFRDGVSGPAFPSPLRCLHDVREKDWNWKGVDGGNRDMGCE